MRPWQSFMQNVHWLWCPARNSKEITLSFLSLSAIWHTAWPQSSAPIQTVRCIFGHGANSWLALIVYDICSRTFLYNSLISFRFDLSDDKADTLRSLSMSNLSICFVAIQQRCRGDPLCSLGIPQHRALRLPCCSLSAGGSHGKLWWFLLTIVSALDLKMRQLHWGQKNGMQRKYGSRLPCKCFISSWLSLFWVKSQQLLTYLFDVNSNFPWDGQNSVVEAYLRQCAIQEQLFSSELF